MHPKRSRGFSVLEILFLFAVLFAIAIPAFIKYSRRARTAEAVMNVSKMAMGAREYYMRASVGKQEAGGEVAFPNSVGPTPELFACLNGEPMKHDPQTLQGVEHFGHESWRSLNFNLSTPFRFRYTFESQGEGLNAFFTARAEGDLDCDDQSSLFEQTGMVESNGLVRINQLFRMNELE